MKKEYGRAEWYALRNDEGECEGFRCGRCGAFAGRKEEKCPSCGREMTNPQGKPGATKCIRI